MIGKKPKKKSKAHEILNGTGADKEIYNWQRTMKRSSFNPSGQRPVPTTGSRPVKKELTRSEYVQEWLKKNCPDLWNKKR
jgi:hypothetical protein